MNNGETPSMISVDTLKWIMSLSSTNRAHLDEFEQMISQRAYKKGLKNHMIAAEEMIEIGDQFERRDFVGDFPGN